VTIRRRAGAILSALLLTVGLSFVVTTPAHATVGGTVECTNGQAIQGIWVEASDPAKRGWASRWSLGSSSRNGWSHAALNPGEWYQINVGCGSWNPTYTSVMWNQHSGDFLCIPYSQGVWNRCWNS
jgi:hypothetical protein